jgi:hypothetical protein
LTGRRGEIDSQGGSVEGPTCFLHVTADGREQVRSTLPNTGLSFVGPQSPSLRHGALLCGEAPGVTEGEWKHCLLLSVEARRGEQHDRGRDQKASADVGGEFSHW